MNEYIFECEDGKVYACIPPNCLVCKNCADVFYDWNGPYMRLCEAGADNFGHDCKLFELENGAVTVEEYERKRREAAAKEDFNQIYKELKGGYKT